MIPNTRIHANASCQLHPQDGSFEHESLSREPRSRTFQKKLRSGIHLQSRDECAVPSASSIHKLRVYTVVIGLIRMLECSFSLFLIENCNVFLYFSSYSTQFRTGWSRSYACSVLGTMFPVCMHLVDLYVRFHFYYNARGAPPNISLSHYPV